MLAKVDTDKLADFLVDRPLTIALILVAAVIANRIVRRAIKRFANGIASRAQGAESLRSAARAQTIAAVLRSLSTGVIYSLALLTVLGEVNIDLAPLIAGAGIVGIAVGFGAQSLVKDFFAGIFILIEDQYGVGDIVDLGDAVGTVEALSLRATRLRDANGTVWHVPNGTILRVGNKSQQWARAVIDMPVASEANTEQASETMKRVADEMVRDEPWSDLVLEAPEVWGVEAVGAGSVTIRLVVKTKPSAQFKLMRELRGRIVRAFEAEGVPMPTQTPTVAPTPKPT